MEKLEKEGTKKRKEQDERADAIAKLRAWLPPGSEVHTVLRHVSRSGMFRRISLLAVVDGELVNLDYFAGKALRLTGHGGEGLPARGCGMDMGFHLVYELSHVLFPDGFGCIGYGDKWLTRCPSNDHSNGDRDYTPHNDPDALKHWHNDGGYALRQRWA